MFGILNRGLRFSGILLATASLVAACTSNKGSDAPAPYVMKIETKPASAESQSILQDQRIATGGSTTAISSGAINPEVTLKLSSLQNRVFLYGADLQYSSIVNMEMFLQSMAIGHEAVRFVVAGDKLQLVADQDYMYESNVNHPVRLVHEWDIVTRAVDEITIRMRVASPVLSGILYGAAAPAVRSNWVRSVKFVEQGQYLMFETSIELADGKIVEFMESIFPRETIVPQGYKPLLADPSREPMAERFRFLGGGAIWMDLPEGRVQSQVATRFHVPTNGTIDWYVTPNIPQEFIRPVQTAIEGWNRYYRAMFGRDVVVFKGLLPADIKIGDPRFNVVNWDSVAEATAAYESQAYDPYTGIQSHSLVYLPKAWVNIGKQYWERGGFSHAREAQGSMGKLADLGLLGRNMKPNCFREIEMQMSLAARTNPDQFAEDLLKGVLFHEIGHALGLAHNFKGSLSFDGDAANPVFSTSIMDYNQYHVEEDAFDKTDSANGPLLEYDRQILSVLYNEGKDIKASDAVLPACDDSEADAVQSGVDPLCTRYDAGKEPTQMLQKTIDLIKDESAKSYKMSSLSTAIKSTVDILGDPAQVTDEDVAMERINTLNTQILGTIIYYYAGGAQGLGYMTQANIKSLRLNSADLPAPFDIAGMRTRVATSIKYVMSSNDLESSTYLAIGVVKNTLMTWMAQTPWFQTLAAAQQTVVKDQLTKTMQAAAQNIAGVVMSNVRVRALGQMAYVETAPFFFDSRGATPVDFEKFALETIEAAAEAKVAGKDRPFGERLAAVTSLISYKSILQGQEAIKRVQSRLDIEATQARTTAERAAVRKLQATLQ